MEPLVAIVVLNYRNGDDTIRCLDSVRRLDYPSYRMVVVDNGSGDDSLNKISQWASKRLLVRYDRDAALSGGLSDSEELLCRRSPSDALVLITTEKNLGYAGGNNIGIRYSLKQGSFFVWILNNDVTVESDSLKIMMETAMKDSRLGLVGAMIYQDNDRRQLQCAGGGYVNFWLGITRHFDQQFDNPKRPFRYINGACFLARKEMLEDIGLLDEDFFLYWEDTDLSLRASRHGWQIDCASKAAVYHKGGATAGIRSPIAEFHHARSGFIFFWKHWREGGAASLAAFIFLKFGRRLLTGRWRALNLCLSGIKQGVQFLRRGY
ncbi:MAG: glycosyltransferase family 2 protein [Elusimicrobia bacterium]|nr:glycosyltransferase family 2 protein [Elusimicrobiota bacterium]